MNDFSVTIFVSNRFQWELDPFFRLFNLFWGEHQIVDVVTNKKPELPYSNLNYIEMGDDSLLIDGDWDFGRYSNGIIWYLKQLQTPEVVILNSDYWMVEPADLKTLAILIAYMQENPDVLRMQIGSGSGIIKRTVPLQRYQGLSIFGCPERNPHCFLKVSWIPAIWSRDLLLRILQPGWNPWECEVEGTEKLKGMAELRSLGCNKVVMRYRHICYTRAHKVHLSVFPSDLAALIKNLIPGDMELC